MKKTSKPIVFFGSGPVAAESLALLAKDFTIEAVITKPRAHHHLGTVPVLELAESLKLPIHTVGNKRDLDALFSRNSITSRLGVLIDFGIIVSQQVIDYFPLGIINSHFSILPEWRGPDPISFAILSGQKKTGVSLMFLVAAMDEGPLLGYKEQTIDATTTTPELTKRLITLSHSLLLSHLPILMAGQHEGSPQTITGKEVSYSRKLTKEDGEIDWNKPAEIIEREIRAFIEWPKSHTKFGDLDVIVTHAHVVTESGTPGRSTVINKLPVVYCGQDALAIDQLKPAGKKEMTGQSFLAGYRNKIIN